MEVVIIRLVFKELSEFEKWISINIEKTRYECYITDTNEVVLVPLRSTQPLKYAYGMFDENTVKKLTSSLELLGISIFKVKSVEWADDRAPGIKIVVE